MKDLTLYEIDKAIEMALANALEESIDPETGEILQGGFEELEQLSEARELKLENIGAYIKNLSAQVTMLKTEEDNLKERRQATEKKIERLKGYVSNSLINANQSKFESPKVAFSFRKSTKVEVVNLDLVPEEYIKTEIKKSADKTAIGRLLKADQAVPGCELITSQNLQIK